MFQQHRPALAQEQARAGVFADSGAWETALLLLFDSMFRGGFWSTLLPLSDHGVGERAATKLSATLLTYANHSSTRNLFGLNLLLRSLGATLLTLLGVLALGLTVLSLS